MSLRGGGVMVDVFCSGYTTFFNHKYVKKLMQGSSKNIGNR